jgi:hypothetical protein
MSTEDLIAKLEAERLAHPLSADALRVAERFRDEMLKRQSHGGLSDVEVKQFEVTPGPKGQGAFAYIVVGRVGDEDTLAQVFCRDTRHILIGAKGGVTLLNGKPKRKGKPMVTIHGFWDALRWITQ